MGNQIEQHGDGIIINETQNSSIYILQGVPSSELEKTKYREELLKKLEALKHKSGEIREDTPTDQHEIGTDNPNIMEIVELISSDGCILFLGPEIALEKGTGLNLHEVQYEQLANQKDDLVYDKEEGFFQAQNNNIIKFLLKSFYSGDFAKKNTVGQRVLTNLAQVPFSLIISFSPDEQIREIFEEFDIEHQFTHFIGNGAGFDELTPSIDSPLIINALGSVSRKGRNIFTVEDFYHYIKEFEFPKEVKHQIQQAAHFLFIGFDFTKWYARLILYMLGIQDKNVNASLLSHKDEKHQNIKAFLKEKFKLSMVESSYIEFTEELLKQVRSEGIIRDLKGTFNEKLQQRLENLETKTKLCSEGQELMDLSLEIETIEHKINAYAG